MSPTLQNIMMRCQLSYDSKEENQWLVREMFCLAAERWYYYDDIGAFIGTDKAHVSDYVRCAIKRYNMLPAYRQRFKDAGFDAPNRCECCGALIK